MEWSSGYQAPANLVLTGEENHNPLVFKCWNLRKILPKSTTTSIDFSSLPQTAKDRNPHTRHRQAVRNHFESLKRLSLVDKTLQKAEERDSYPSESFAPWQWISWRIPATIPWLKSILAWSGQILVNIILCSFLWSLGFISKRHQPKAKREHRDSSQWRQWSRSPSQVGPSDWSAYTSALYCFPKEVVTISLWFSNHSLGKDSNTTSYSTVSTVLVRNSNGK